MLICWQIGGANCKILAICNFYFTVTPGGVASTSQMSEDFYKEVWFMALMIVIGLVLLFAMVVLCFKCIQSSRPYIRERSPLRKRRERAIEGYSDEDTSSGSVFGTVSYNQKCLQQQFTKEMLHFCVRVQETVHHVYNKTSSPCFVFAHLILFLNGWI